MECIFDVVVQGFFFCLIFPAHFHHHRCDATQPIPPDGLDIDFTCKHQQRQKQLQPEFIEKMKQKLLMNGIIIMVITKEITNIMTDDSQISGEFLQAEALIHQPAGMVADKKHTVFQRMWIPETLGSQVRFDVAVPK